MNQIRAIQALNKREIENGVSPEASWHADYRDTAFIYFGGLPYDMSEGDVVTIFSQFGEPVFLKLARDKETGKSKGFGWLKYEDQRSTDLAVDNFGGAEIAGRMIRVDHARYKHRDDEDPNEGRVSWEDMMRLERAEKGLPSDAGSDEDSEEETTGEKRRPLLKEEKELQLLIENHDDDDPMKQYLIDEKKKEIEEALEEALEKERKRSESRSHRHRHRHKDKDGHHRSHRSRKDVDKGRDRRRDRSREKGSSGRMRKAATTAARGIDMVLEIGIAIEMQTEIADLLEMRAIAERMMTMFTKRIASDTGNVSERAQEIQKADGIAICKTELVGTGTGAEADRHDSVGRIKLGPTTR
ncbi:hypothetical protein B0T25DRAFT_563533 [Lasiosphaeria hispida]|uniref:RRM domain-containing protein n=1 Tax=Lasiosphaeria hispida TaxID=260671 RepID=A0AAJ0HXJ0_9PEZI|nr:hypothetical protein B0T25DRAFT_563533 [Lasiosphaeria hispida]